MSELKNVLCATQVFFYHKKFSIHYSFIALYSNINIFQVIIVQLLKSYNNVNFTHPDSSIMEEKDVLAEEKTIVFEKDYTLNVFVKLSFSHLKPILILNVLILQ